MEKKLRFRLPMIGIGIVALLLAGCVASPSDEATGTPDETPATTVAGEEAPGTTIGAEESSDTLIVAEETAPVSLDPTQADAITSWYPWALVYDSLVRVLADGSMTPMLATDWTISEDGLTYVFTLRDGVKFHNGDPLTADDVVFSYQRVLDDAIPYTQARFPTLVSIQETGPLEVTFTLSAVDAGFMNNMGDPFEVGTAVLSRKAAAAEDPATKMMGTGPYKMVSYVPDQKLTLVRNDDYWGERPKTKNLEILYMPDQSAQVAALRAGQIDLMFPTSESLLALEGTDAVIVDVQSATIMQLEINPVFNPALGDLRVRTAIARAIDRDAIIEKALLGAGVSSAHFPSALSYAVPPSDIENYTYDPDLSRQLLAEAGFADGLDLTLDVFSTAPAYILKYAEVLQSQLKDVGINVEIVNGDFATWLDKLNGGKFQLLVNWTSYKSDPIWYTKVRPGRYGPVPAEIAAMEASIQAATPDELPSLLQEFEQLQAAMVWPNLAIGAVTQSIATRPGVDGVNPDYTLSRTFLTGITAPK